MSDTNHATEVTVDEEAPAVPADISEAERLLHEAGVNPTGALDSGVLALRALAHVMLYLAKEDAGLN